MPPAGAAPTTTDTNEPLTEAQLIEGIEGYFGQQVDSKPAEKTAKDETEGDDEAVDKLEDGEADAGDKDDQGDDEGEEKTTADKGSKEKGDEVATLREQLAEMRGRMEAMTAALTGRQGKEAPITDSGRGGAATPPGESDTTEDADQDATDLKAIGDLMTKALGTDEEKGDWRELLQATGLDKLPGLLSRMAAKESARSKAESEAKAEQQKAQEREAESHTREIDKTLTAIAKAQPDIGEMIGTTMLGAHSDAHMEARQSILIEARHQMARSHQRVKLGYAKSPMTATQALTAAVRAITGKAVQSFVGNPKDTEGDDDKAKGKAPSKDDRDEAQKRRDAAAKARARQVRPESGGGVNRVISKDEKGVERELAASIDDFFKGR